MNIKETLLRISLTAITTQRSSNQSILALKELLIGTREVWEVAPSLILEIAFGENDAGNDQPSQDNQIGQTQMTWLSAMIRNAAKFVAEAERKLTIAQTEQFRNKALSDSVPTIDRDGSELRSTEIGRFIYGEWAKLFADSDIEDTGATYTSISDIKIALDDLYEALQFIYLPLEQKVHGWKEDYVMEGLPWGFRVNSEGEFSNLYSFNELYLEHCKQMDNYKLQKTEAARKAKANAIARAKALMSQREAA